MKHKLIVGCAVVAVLVLGALSVQAHNHHQAKVNAQAQARQRQFISDSLKIDRLQKQVDKLNATCKNFQNVFTQLPVATKLKTPVPDCSL